MPLCTGVIVNEKFIVTSAYCAKEAMNMVEEKQGNFLKIIAGTVFKITDIVCACELFANLYFIFQKFHKPVTAILMHLHIIVITKKRKLLLDLARFIEFVLSEVSICEIILEIFNVWNDVKIEKTKTWFL